MPYDVDIVVLSNIPKELGSDIEVIVGLPTKDPRSLPFGHRRLFYERADDYDLYIYTEDDTLLRKKNIEAFLHVTQVLPENEIAGFVRYELDSSRGKYISTVHSHYHWVPDSVKTIGEYTFAHFTNAHSACHILTQEQLKMVISSGGYLVAPHQGRYALLETAATDPYTQCGLTKMICISHWEDFLIHHLPNQYIGELGLKINEFQMEIEALLSMKSNEKFKGQLFQTEKNLPTSKWDKKYYEKCRFDILELIPRGIKSVLSVGCGWGETEAKLVEKGIRVVCIPLDSIIGVHAEAKGIEVVYPGFDKALDILADEHFDCVIFSEVLQHLPDPADILSRFSKLLADDGILIASVPNFNHVKVWRDFLSKNLPYRDKKMFDRTQLHFSTKATVKKWLAESGLEEDRIIYGLRERYRKPARLSLGMLNDFLASQLIFMGRK